MLHLHLRPMAIVIVMSTGTIMSIMCTTSRSLLRAQSGWMVWETWRSKVTPHYCTPCPLPPAPCSLLTALAVHPFTDEDVQPTPPVTPTANSADSTDSADAPDTDASITALPRQSSGTFRIGSSTNIKSAFTNIISTDVNESMFLSADRASDGDIDITMKAALKTPKVLLGWKIQLLDSPFEDVRIVVAIKKVPFKHTMFCLFSLLGADASVQAEVVDGRPQETEWCRLKRDGDGRPYRLIKKIAS